MIPGKWINARRVVGWERFSLQMEWWRAGRMNLFRGNLSTEWPPGHIWPIAVSEQLFEGQWHVRIQNKQHISCNLSHFNHQILFDGLCFYGKTSFLISRKMATNSKIFLLSQVYNCSLHKFGLHTPLLDMSCVLRNSVKYLDGMIFF